MDYELSYGLTIPEFVFLADRQLCLRMGAKSKRAVRSGFAEGFSAVADTVIGVG